MANEDEYSKKYGKQIGCGKTAAIYEKDGIVAKVYVEGFPKTEIYREAFIMTLIEYAGIESTRVLGIETYLGRDVVKMNKIEGKALDDALIDGDITPEEFADRLVKLEIGVHKIHAPNSDFVNKKDQLIKNIRWNPRLTEDEKKDFISRIEKMPDGDSICHGDFHGRNVLTDGKKDIILDWPEVSVGNPAADACRTYLDYKYLVTYGEGGVDPSLKDTVNKISDLFIEKYSKASGISKEDILAWLPINAISLYGYIMDEDINKALKSLAE